jgi:DNA-binding CsgD family transcriptional regulator
MTLSLSSERVAAIAATLRVLLSPHEYNGGNEWHKQVMQTASRAFGVDKAMLILPRDSIAPLSTDGIDPKFLRDYAAHFYARDEGATRVCARSLSRFNREMVVNGDWAYFHSTDLYNELFVPYKHLDDLGIAYAPDTRAPSKLALLVVKSDRANDERFGDQGLAIADLLLPAFRAGAQARVRIGQVQQGLEAIAETIPHGIRIAGERGVRLFQNSALTQWLSQKPSGSMLEAAIKRTVASLAAIAYRQREPRDTAYACRRCSEIVLTPSGRFRVSASLSVDSHFGHFAAIALVERLDISVATVPELQKRFALTQREAEIASMLACSALSTKEIAERLSISAHTARHHMERIFAKAGVHRRAEFRNLVESGRA